MLLTRNRERTLPSNQSVAEFNEKTFVIGSGKLTRPAP